MFIKRMILAFVLVSFSSCVVHAAESNKDKAGKHEDKNKRAKKEKNKEDDNVTVLDMSGPDEPEDSMPAITPKGKL